jgi:16S rRNA (guanine527-N7)-methyltransferase
MSNSNRASFSDLAISRALAPFGVEPSAALASAIREYAELLLRWNQKLNLTSISDPLEMLQRHFGESMFAARAIPMVRGCLVDVGSGAGFPGLALKLVAPGLEVSLVEANVKKSTFLSEVVRTLGLTGVKVISKRIEELNKLAGAAEFVTCRAVRPDRRLLAWVQKALAPGGMCVMWLGAKDASHLQKLATWEWEPVLRIPLSSNRVILTGRAALK